MTRDLADDGKDGQRHDDDKPSAATITTTTTTTTTSDDGLKKPAAEAETLLRTYNIFGKAREAGSVWDGVSLAKLSEANFEERVDPNNDTYWLPEFAQADSGAGAGAGGASPDPAPLIVSDVIHADSTSPALQYNLVVKKSVIENKEAKFWGPDFHKLRAYLKDGKTSASKYLELFEECGTHFVCQVGVGYKSGSATKDGIKDGTKALSEKQVRESRLVALLTKVSPLWMLGCLSDEERRELRNRFVWALEHLRRDSQQKHIGNFTSNDQLGASTKISKKIKTCSGCKILIVTGADLDVKKESRLYKFKLHGGALAKSARVRVQIWSLVEGEGARRVCRLKHDQLIENLEVGPKLYDVEPRSEGWAIKPDDLVGIAIASKNASEKKGRRDSLISCRPSANDDRENKRECWKPVCAQKKLCCFAQGDCEQTNGEPVLFAKTSLEGPYSVPLIGLVLENSDIEYYKKIIEDDPGTESSFDDQDIDLAKKVTSDLKLAMEKLKGYLKQKNDDDPNREQTIDDLEREITKYRDQAIRMYQALGKRSVELQTEVDKEKDAVTQQL